MTVRAQFHLLQYLCDLCITTHTMESSAPDKCSALKTSGLTLRRKKIKPARGGGVGGHIHE